MNYTVSFFLFTLIVKIILGVVIPLCSDEAYYWVWAHNMQLSFFDHPPMVSWLFFLGIPFERFLSGPRIPGIVLGHITLFIWFKIISPHLDLKKQKWLLWALLLTPLTGLGSLIITPDLPLLFFWSVSLLFFLKLTAHKKSTDAIILGAALGLGFCSKYHMVLFFPLAFLWLFHQRRELVLPLTAYVNVAVAFLVFSFPVLYWNYTNDFISFKFQLNHGLGQVTSSPYWSLKYIFDQFILILPPILFLAWRKPENRRLDWLRYFGWGPVLFFLITSLKGRVEANWPLVGIPALVSLAVINSDSSLNWIKGSVAAWASIFVIILGIIFLPLEGFKISNSKIRELRDMKALLPLTEEYSPLYVSTYQMASLLTYYSRKPIYKLKGVGRIDFFDFLDASMPKDKKFFWIAPSASYLPVWLDSHAAHLVGPNSVATDSYLFEVVSP
ncbi:MAG: glycosyltransferase family 39 protein [Pseudomonadota bacterium]|nr:glycosyltransferase family 39 protein [Pseudomonadota bacterium]